MSENKPGHVFATRDHQAQITEIEERITYHKLQVTQLEERKILAERALQQALRSSSASNRLPFELLGSIFKYAIKEDASDIMRLLQVSRAWYVAAVNHQQLWSTISIQGPFQRRRLGDLQRYISLCYERSGDLPLEVIFTTHGLTEAGEECSLVRHELGLIVDHDGEKVMTCQHLRSQCMFWRSHANTAVELLTALFLRDTTRWRSFHLDWPYHVGLKDAKSRHFDPQVLSLITETCSSLEELYIANSATEFSYGIKIGPGLRRLRRLELIDQWWDFSQSKESLPSLKELMVELPDEGEWINFLTSLRGTNMLQKFPNVANLTLRTRSGATNPFPHRLGASFATKYPSLKRLRLIGPIPPNILRSWAFPNLQKLTILSNEDNKSSTRAVSLANTASASEILELRDASSEWSVYGQLLDSMSMLHEVRLGGELWERIIDTSATHLPEFLVEPDAVYNTGTFATFTFGDSLDSLRLLFTQLVRRVGKAPETLLSCLPIPTCMLPLPSPPPPPPPPPFVPTNSVPQL